MIELKNKKLNIICDCDEVITNISPKWLNGIYERKDFFEKYFDLNPEYLENNNVLLRTEFYLNKWLLKDNIELTEEENETMMKEFFKIHEDKNFYFDCEPTKFAKNLLNFYYTGGINKIYVVTRCLKNNYEEKIEFIKKVFPIGDSLEIIVVPKDSKKSDYINKLVKCDIDVLIDDELNNINDIVENCSCIKNNKVDIFIPYLGYNQLTSEEISEFEKKNKKIIYYSAL